MVRVGGRIPDIEQDKVELEGEGWRKKINLDIAEDKVGIRG